MSQTLSPRLLTAKPAPSRFVLWGAIGAVVLTVVTGITVEFSFAELV